MYLFFKNRGMAIFFMMIIVKSNVETQLRLLLVLQLNY